MTETVLKAREFLFEEIIDKAKDASLMDNYSKTDIVVSSIEEDLGVIGASTLVLNNIFSLNSVNE